MKDVCNSWFSFLAYTESHDLGIKTVLPLQQVFQKISFQQLSNEELNCLIQNKVFVEGTVCDSLVTCMHPSTKPSIP